MNKETNMTKTLILMDYRRFFDGKDPDCVDWWIKWFKKERRGLMVANRPKRTHPFTRKILRALDSASRRDSAVGGVGQVSSPLRRGPSTSDICRQVLDVVTDSERELLGMLPGGDTELMRVDRGRALAQVMGHPSCIDFAVA